MSIRIRSTSLEAGGEGGQPPDGFLDKIVKSIPSQVIGFYTAAIVALGGAIGQAATPTNSPSPKLWIPFVIGVIMTPLLTWKQTQDPSKPPAYVQIIIATISFVVWAFATGGPFAGLGFWDATIGGIVLGAYTLVLGVIPQN